LQFQLLDALVQLLRLAPKAHTPQLRQQQLQVFDLLFAGEQLFLLG